MTGRGRGGRNSLQTANARTSHGGRNSPKTANPRTSQASARTTRSGTTTQDTRNEDVQVRVVAGGLRGMSGTVTQVSSSCQFCHGSPLDNNAIGCDTCESWYHGSSLCTGLKEETIAAILGDDAASIRFVCSKCRCSSPPARSSPQAASE